jgi:hypothetical protein
MQVIYKRLSARLSEEDRQTFATWRNGVIAFYGILFIIAAIFLVVDTRLDRQVADQDGQVQRKTASSHW